MFARVETVDRADIPQEDSISNYDGLQIVREIVEYDSVKERYHPSLNWVEVSPNDGVSPSQVYNPETGIFGPEPSLPEINISLSAGEIMNNGADEVTITFSVSGVRDQDPDSWAGTVTVGETDLSHTYQSNVETTETMTTTKSEGTTINIIASADGLKRASTEIEVVAP